MTKEKKRAPINISETDVERAYKKVESFQRILKRGKTKEQILNDMLRLIQGGK